MLIVPPPKRKSRGRERQAPAAGVLIYAVQLLDATTALWRFSSEYDGDGTCSELMVNDGVGGWISPDGVDGWDSKSIRAYYTTASLNLSSSWQLLAQLDGFTFADGLLIVPQGGMLTA